MTSPPIARPAVSRAIAVPRVPADALAVGALLLLTAVGVWDLVVGGTTVGQDTAAFFYPVYEALGDRLRGGDWLPGWTPHQFGGAPLAADPQSGWGYLPAMLLFALLPLEGAAPAFLVGHLLLAGLATYALGRVLGLDPLGALTAAVAYEFSGQFYARGVCCPAYTQVSAWLPVMVLGAELAIRARRWPARIGWWGVAGLGLSQILASWPGQGSYYALLALGGFVAYRALLAPPAPPPGWGRRAVWLGLHGGALLAVGFGLAAAGLLPRLEYNRLSNLAGGYEGEAIVSGGWDVPRTVGQLLNKSLFYTGGATLALACIGLILARGRFAAPYFAALSVGPLVLAQREETWLHALLYALLPRFEDLHPHVPERALVVFFLGPAVLAGAAVTLLRERRGRVAVAAAVAAVPVLGVLALDEWVAPVEPRAVRTALVAGIGVVALARFRSPAVRLLVPLVLVVVLFADLLALGRFNVAHGPFGGFHKLDLGEYYAPGSAGEFLRERRGGPPFRFVGHSPRLVRANDGQYRWHFMDPEARALLLNNRATVLGLQDVQGYDPVQLQRFVDFMVALNGRGQEYREANVLPGGLASPLLDLLNVRYLVLPAAVPPDRPDLAALLRDQPTVYEDDRVRILENREAVPRAWIVHEARRVATGEALPLLASGAVDPRRVALVETDPPDLRPAADPAADRSEVVSHEADRLTVRVSSDAPGLLVLSEIAYPAWVAEVDGERAPVLTVDHALRAVPIPAGEHTVELRYESRWLRVGALVSLATVGLLVVGVGVASWRERGARGSRAAPNGGGSGSGIGRARGPGRDRPGGATPPAG